jgi:hypothetical protein
MGEVVLRRIQVGIEATRGTAVAATKKIYGTLTPTRGQARRYPVEDRGMFVDKFRANPKLVEAGFTIAHDMLFEDVPLFAALYLNGGAVSSGSSGLGYTWSIAPDTNTDTLKTLTLEAGDETVAWQGSFGTVDSSDWTLALDDAVTASTVGFVRDWIPQQPSNPNSLQGGSPYTAPGIPSTFTGFTGALSERVVESVMGWQQRIYLDVAGTNPGTTQLVGRLKAGAWGIHNQNKRKYFGDGSAVFTKLGRGRRQIHCQLTFEAIDTAQYQAFYNLSEAVIRLQFIGSAITGTNLATTTSSLTAGATITTIPVSALAQAIGGGTGINVGGVTFAVTAAGAAMSATSIPVQSQVMPITVATSATVMAAKTVNFDFWGFWDTWTQGNTDTNTTYQMDLQAVYDITPGKEFNLTVINGNSAL